MRFFKPNIKRLSERHDVSRLMRALADRDLTVSCAAADALRDLGDASAIEPLLKAFLDWSSAANFHYESALEGILARGTLDQAISALKSSHVKLRAAAAKALEIKNDSGALEALITALGESGDPKVYSNVAGALKSLSENGKVQDGSLERLVNALLHSRDVAGYYETSILLAVGDRALGQLRRYTSVLLNTAIGNMSSGQSSAIVDLLNKVDPRWGLSDAQLRSQVAGLITTIERSKRYVSIPGEHGGKKSSGPDHGPAEKVGSSLNILRTFLRFQVSRLNPAILSRIGKLGDNISVTMGKYDCIDGYGEEEQSFDIADLRQTARQELVRRKQKK